MISTGKNTVLDREEKLGTDYEDNTCTAEAMNTAKFAREARTEERQTSYNDGYNEDIENADTLPSLTAMQWYQQNEETDDIAEEDDLNVAKKSYKISPRGKIMIAIYTLVIATIVALIAINARVLKSMEESVVEKEATVQALINQTQQLSEELEYVSSDEVVSARAEEIGMTK